MAQPDATAEFVAQYAAELRDLTFNSKTMINTLTMLANENQSAAPGVAEAIEQRISTSAPAHKLPALYLLDSIVKNVGLPYTALFARDLPEVFMATWHAMPQSQAALQRLYNTWHRFFPSGVMSDISQRMAAPQVSEAAPSQPQQPAPAPAYAYSQPLPPPPGQGGATWQPQPQPQPQQAGQYMQPAPAAGYLNGYMQPQAQQPLQAPGQWGFPGAPAPPQQQFVAAYTPTYPQPQHAAVQPLQPGHSPSYVSPPYPAQSPAYAGPSPGSQQQPQAAGGSAALPAFLSQLIDAGIIPPSKAGPPAAAPAAAAAAAQPPTSFAVLKEQETAAAAVAQLMEGTAASKARFLDLRLHRQRKRTAGGATSRRWFVREDDWLAGTTADETAAPSFFDEPEEERAPAAEASVPADPEQPNCGLSGEAFESVWDDASNGWRYRGAAALDAEQAARYGLPEGTLVKVSCLGPPGAPPELEPAVDVVRGAEGQATADAVSEAAQEETAGPSLQDADKKVGAREWREPVAGEEPSPKKQRL